MQNPMLQRHYRPQIQAAGGGGVVLSSLATSLASRGLSLTELETGIGSHSTGGLVGGGTNHANQLQPAVAASRNKMLLIQDSSNQREHQLKQDALVYVRVNPVSKAAGPSAQQQMLNHQNNPTTINYYLDQELASATPDLSKIWRNRAKDEILHNETTTTLKQHQTQNMLNQSSKEQMLLSTSFCGSTEALHTMQQQQQHLRQQQGNTTANTNNAKPSQQQMMRIFDDINIAKLTNDKALNRHIHGMSLPPSSTVSNHPHTSTSAAVQIESNRDRRAVTRQRQKTMIAQHEATRRGQMRGAASALALSNSHRSKDISVSSVNRKFAGASGFTNPTTTKRAGGIGGLGSKESSMISLF